METETDEETEEPDAEATSGAEETPEPTVTRAETEEDETEEERRLLYVGMTRAKDRLFLSHALKRKGMGGYKNLEISPFLVKIKDDLLKLSKFEREHKEKDNSSQLSLF